MVLGARLLSSAKINFHAASAPLILRNAFVHAGEKRKVLEAKIDARAKNENHVRK